MSRNRIIYNTQGLFVAPYSGEQKAGTDYFLNGYQILKKIEKVQNFDYSIEQPNIDFIAFGSKKSVARIPSNNPNITFNFSYLSDGVTNENRLNFNPAIFSTTSQKPMFSGICQADSVLDEKDFYLVINNSNLDLSKNYTLTNESVNPTTLADIIDPDARNYSVLEFKNSYITEYSFRVQLGDLPIVNQGYTCDNINFYSSGSGIKVSVLDLKSGIKQNLTDEIVIPRSLRYNQTGISGQNILNPGDAQVTFYNSISTGVLFYTDTIQNFSYDLRFKRKGLESLNYKFPLSKNILYPVGGTMSMSFIVDENLTGSFFDTLNSNIDYNILVDFNPICSKSGVSPTRFIFSGCKFNDINYSSSIGSNKTADLTFNIDIDPDFGTRGIFCSGNALYGNINNQRKILIY